LHFHQEVARALELIPPEFQEKMENVEVIVEEFPDQETLDTVGLTSKWDLLGLYVGVPISQQSFFMTNPYPERIYLYRRPILRAARLPELVTEVIRDVVIHEMGHHLGFSDEELYEMTGESE
jgi:predicted Zn-dependent protease with MMP-like domain